MQENTLKAKFFGAGTIQVLVLILVIGIILLVILDGVTTSVVVMKQLDYSEQTKKLAISYLEVLSQRSEDKEFFENMQKIDIPPVPLTSEYTLNGFYSVNIYTETLSRDKVKVFITYRLSSEPSFSDKENVYSTIITDSENFQ